MLDVTFTPDQTWCLRQIKAGEFRAEESTPVSFQLISWPQTSQRKTIMEGLKHETSDSSSDLVKICVGLKVSRYPVFWKRGTTSFSQILNSDGGWLRVEQRLWKAVWCQGRGDVGCWYGPIKPAVQRIQVICQLMVLSGVGGLSAVVSVSLLVYSTLKYGR